MKNWTISVWCLLISLSSLWGQQADVQFRTLSETDGLSQGVVTSLLQDQRGFMWLGTQNGLNRYDGYSFITYSFDENDSLSLPGNYIRALYEDRNGMIWIGTERGGLCRYNRALDHFERTPITESVRSLVEDRDGTLWIGTRKGLYEWQVDSNPRLVDPEDGLWSAKPGIEALWVDAQDQIWIGTEEGLFVMDVAREVRGPLVSQDDISVLEVHCLYEDADGQLWVGGDEGLFTVDPLNEEILRPIEALEHDLLSRAEINAITGDRRGNLWIATFGRGLVRLQKNEGLFQVYTQPEGTEEGLPSDFLYALCLDASGLLWIGTYGNGLSQLNLVRVFFSFMGEESPEEAGFYNPEIYCMWEQEVDKLWAGTPQGLAYVDLEKQTVETFRTRDGLIDDEIYCLMEDRDGALWIGTVSGLDVLPAGANPGPGSFRNFEQLNGNTILSLMESRDGTRWIGTDFGLFALRDTLSGPFLKDLSIQALYKDRDGSMWMGTSRGLFQYDREGDVWEQDTLWPEEIRRSSVMSVLSDERQALWVGTEGRGLYNWSPGDTLVESFAVDTSPFPDNTVYSLLPDEEGQIWASTNLGLVRISRERAGGGLVFTNFDTRNRLPCENFNPAAAARGASGTLYFGCSEGMVWFQGDDIRENTYAPPVVLTEFQLAFEPVPISEDGSSPLEQAIWETQELQLKHTQNVLYFEFSALNYIGNEKNQYAFRMIPYTQNLVYSGTKRS
ncbi:MAG: two-component regulator propeller domain-containing protein, partial [Bacteroidota bacterium]